MGGAKPKAERGFGWHAGLVLLVFMVIGPHPIQPKLVRFELLYVMYCYVFVCKQHKHKK